MMLWSCNPVLFLPHFFFLPEEWMMHKWWRINRRKWEDWPVDENGDHHQVLIFCNNISSKTFLLEGKRKWKSRRERERNIILILRTADTYLNHHHHQTSLYRHHPYPPLFHNFFRMFSETTQGATSANEIYRRKRNKKEIHERETSFSTILQQNGPHPHIKTPQLTNHTNNEKWTKSWHFVLL